MDPALPGPWRCERCGGEHDLYLLTLPAPYDPANEPTNEPAEQRLRMPELPWQSALRAGNSVVRCGGCRRADQGENVDVAIPLSLLTPRLVLGLQRLHKLEGNLSLLLRADARGDDRT